MLEGYSYDEAWPEVIRGFSVSYLDPARKSAFGSLG
jgi:hypothetical protein